LYEQTLAARFPEIIQEYTGDVQKKLKEAADVWRLPYWDWVYNPALPVEFTTSTIEIYGTDGGLTPLSPNPFGCYTFKKMPPPDFPSGTPELLVYPHTMRCPSTKKADAISQTENVNTNLQGSKLKSNVWNLFQFATTWDLFGSDGSVGGVGSQISLESVHNKIHHCVGGIGINKIPKGHMLPPDTAAFDPIFWLHHCQVERLLTWWQMIHPESKIPDKEDARSSPPYPHVVTNS